jgi:hypothetical protein
MSKKRTKEQKDYVPHVTHGGQVAAAAAQHMHLKMVAFWTKLVYTVQYKQLQNGA